MRTVKTPFLHLLCTIFLCTACSKVDFTPMPIQNNSAITTNNSVTLSQVVAYGNKQVDFLIVFDDSNSMLPDLQKLAAGLGSFVSSLENSNLDWQMCMTTTRTLDVSGIPTWGKSYSWIGYTPPAGYPDTILRKGTSNLDNIFTNTVNSLTIGGPGSGDERAIKAAFEHFKKGVPGANNSNGCYRQNAAVSVILVSNEDERSIGGDPAKLKPTDAADSYQPLETEDLPANLIAQAQNSFGQNVHFIFNSIIVMPEDSACEAQQDSKSSSPSHPGFTYSMLSNLTYGGIGSVCDSNFASSLNTFRDKIVNSLSDLTLSCDPKSNTMKVSINGNLFTNYIIAGNTIKFKTPLIEGTKIDLSFDCQ